MVELQVCEPSANFFGMMGVTAAIVFANLGAAYGTAKSGVGISCMGVMRPDMVMRSIIPVVMAGVRGNALEPRLFVGLILILIFAEALGLYGLIVGLVVASGSDKGAGLCK